MTKMPITFTKEYYMQQSIYSNLHFISDRIPLPDHTGKEFRSELFHIVFSYRIHFAFVLF